jgi:spermidine dehydrogenase
MDMTNKRDLELGMTSNISRRDFFEGMSRVAFGAAAASAMGVGGAAEVSAANGDSGYPPARLRDRGQNPGSNKIGHALRDGTFWIDAGNATNSGETYDLVVVGAGISGLAAAVLYRQRMGRKAKVLILDPMDDFGGHAKRNEFKASDGSTLIGYGGSQSLQTPSYFSPAVKALMRDLQLDLTKFKTKFYNESFYENRGLESGWFFGKEQFGSDALVRASGKAADYVPNMPLNAKAKADLIQLIDSPPDYLAGKTREEKFELLSKTTYKDFLLNIAKVDPQVVAVYQNSTTDYFGAEIDAVTALDAWGNYNPGFSGLDLGETPHKSMSPSGRLVLTDPDPYIYHFPDGNARVEFPGLTCEGHGRPGDNAGRLRPIRRRKCQCAHQT